MKKLILLLLPLMVACGQEQSRDLDFTKMIDERPEKHIFAMDDYLVWCNGVIKGDDGKYHMFFSRWPRSRGFDAWVTHSEVAHGVSDDLFGPYEFSDVALPARGNEYWDGDNTHNPHVVKFGSKYYLYYTGDHGSGYWYDTPSERRPTMSDDEWWVNRNNQRVGVAVAESLYGPWTRFDKPLIDTTAGRLMTATPTVMQRHDGKYMLVYKTVIKKGDSNIGAVKHFVSTSDSPLGPFADYPEPFITSPTSDFPIDDHVEWWQDGKYYCIAKDHAVNFKKDAGTSAATASLTEYGEALILFESADGYEWKLAPHPLVHKFEITFADGTHYDFDRFEMPKPYIEDGRIKALFLAAKPEGEDNSFSVALPVNEPAE